jgi:hypothetical protein
MEEMTHAIRHNGKECIRGDEKTMAIIFQNITGASTIRDGSPEAFASYRAYVGEQLLNDRAGFREDSLLEMVKLPDETVHSQRLSDSAFCGIA